MKNLKNILEKTTGSITFRMETIERALDPDELDQINADIEEVKTLGCDVTLKYAFKYVCEEYTMNADVKVQIVHIRDDTWSISIDIDRPRRSDFIVWAKR